jgi:hypothetical protein
MSVCGAIALSEMLSSIIIVTFFLFLLFMPVVISHPYPQRFSSGELGKNARQKTGPFP